MSILVYFLQPTRIIRPSGKLWVSICLHSAFKRPTWLIDPQPMPDGVYHRIACPHHDAAYRQPSKRYEAGYADAEGFHPLPLLNGRPDLSMVFRDRFFQRHDLIPELRIDFATDGNGRFKMSDLVRLLIKPAMNDGSAFVGIPFFFLEIDRHSVLPLLELAECEHYVCQ